MVIHNLWLGIDELAPKNEERRAMELRRRSSQCEKRRKKI